MTTQRILITGGNAGLGYYAAEALAASGHHLILAGRNAQKIEAARSSIHSRVPGAQLSTFNLDLASLTSVEQAAEELLRQAPIDVFLLNAGVVTVGEYQLTQDGFELHMGTNHLGHFALLAHLMPTLLKQQRARILHLGSISHRWARIPQQGIFAKHYRDFPSYALSKLAVMTFGFELARRFREGQHGLESIVVHPGFSWDHFDQDVPAFLQKRPLPWYLATLLKPVAQGKRLGASVLTHAALSSEVHNGDYWGPEGFFQTKGAPSLVPAKRHSYDREAADHLWQESERLTGTRISVT